MELDLLSSSFIASRDDFDKLWLDAVKEAAKEKGNPEKDVSSSEQSFSGTSRDPSDPCFGEPTPRQGHQGKNKKLVSANTSSNGRSDDSMAFASPRRSHSQPVVTPLPRPSVQDKFLSTESPTRSTTVDTIVSEFSALTQKHDAEESRGVSPPEHDAAPERLKKVSLTVKTTNNIRVTKLDMQREAAKCVLHLMGHSSAENENFLGQPRGLRPKHQPQPQNHQPPIMATSTSFSIPVIIQISAYKDTPERLTGLVLSLNRGNEIGTVMVKDITPTSIFAHTPLRPGHEILTINKSRVKCPQRAAKIMRSLSGEVKLLVSEGGRPMGTRYIRVRRRRTKE